MESDIVITRVLPIALRMTILTYKKGTGDVAYGNLFGSDC